MFRFLTAGESHGPGVVAVIEGLPAGLAIDPEAVNRQLARRQSGFGRGGRMRIEQDRAEFLSGIRFGETLGSPVTLLIRNRDWQNWQEAMSSFGPAAGGAVTSPRPGHADLPGIVKYERQDVRDILERASARETAARVAVGAVARQLLQLVDIRLVSHVVSIGDVHIKGQDVPFADIERLQEQSELSCIEPDTEEQMRQAVLRARESGDSLGGVFEVLAANIPVGLGSHVQWDRRLDTRLAAAVMSIPAIKGVEFGAGFAAASLPGSLVHDEIFYDAQRGYYRRTNRAGGIEGGMSNGEDVVIRAAMKPIPTLMKPLCSVDIVSRQPIAASTERSDVTAVPAAAVVGEAMTAIVLAEAVLEKFGGDSVGDLSAAVRHYRRRI